MFAPQLCGRFLSRVGIGLTVCSAKTVGVRILESGMKKKRGKLQRQKNTSPEVEIR